MATFRDLVPPRRADGDDDVWVARGNARRGETVEEALARGVKIDVVPTEWRSGELRQCRPDNQRRSHE